jgi:hypothetical protein
MIIPIKLFYMNINTYAIILRNSSTKYVAIPLSYKSELFRRHLKTMKAIGIALGHPPEFVNNTLLVKTLGALLTDMESQFDTDQSQI